MKQMILRCFLIAVLIVLPVIDGLPLEAQQLPVTTTAQTQNIRTTFATQYGNTAAPHLVTQVSGVDAHEVVYTVDPSVTALTVTVSGSSNGGATYSSCGTSNLLGAAITCTGGYNAIRVAITAYAGAGGVNITYLGATSVGATSGTVTANAGTNLNTSLLALDSTLTDGTQKSQICDSGGDCATVTGSKLDVNTVVTSAAVTQSTSPWVVSASGNFGVTQSTSPWTVQGADTPGIAGAPLTIQGNASGVSVPVTITPDVYSTALTTYANGQNVSFHYDPNGALLIAGMTGLTMNITSIGNTVISTALTTAGVVSGYQCVNTDTNWAFLKIFDTSGTVQVGTSPIAKLLGIPPSGGTLPSGIMVPFRIHTAMKIAAVTTESGSTSPVNDTVQCTFDYKAWP